MARALALSVVIGEADEVMLARWTLLFAVLILATGLFFLAGRRDRAADSALELGVVEGESSPSLRARDLEAPVRPTAEQREPVRFAGPEPVIAGESELRSYPELSSGQVAKEEFPSADAPPLPWHLDARHVITEQRIGGAITVQDPSGELTAETHFMPTTLSGEWRNRTILLRAEGYRPVVVANDSGAGEKVCMLCPIRSLQLEIRPPHEGDAACDVVLRDPGRHPGRRLLQSEIGAGEVRHETILLGAQSELLLQVSLSGVVGARDFLFEEPISLAPVGDTPYVLDLAGLRYRDLGSLRTVLRFRDRVYGSDSWTGSLHFADSREGEDDLAEVARARWASWEQSANGFQLEWTLDRIACGNYRFRFEPLGVERDVEILSGVGSELLLEVPSLGTVEVGIRWASEHNDRPKGYQKFGVKYSYSSGKGDGVPLLSLLGSLNGGGELGSPWTGTAELSDATQSLYRISAPVGSELVLTANPGRGRRVEEARTRVVPGIQRVELEAHPFQIGAKGKQGP